MLSRQAVSASFPALDGLVGILPDHAPLISQLGKGEVTVRDSDGRHLLVEVAEGTAEVRDNVLTILARHAGKPHEGKGGEQARQEPAPKPH